MNEGMNEEPKLYKLNNNNYYVLRPLHADFSPEKNTL